MTEAWRLSAATLAAAIADGCISAVEAMRSVLDHAAATGGALNAFATLDAEGALRAATQADADRAAREPLGPLHGVPVSVKDLVLTAGLETAYGSHAMAGNMPDRDAEAVARLRRAGAIVFGKTTTPEFGHKVLTDSPRYGISRNPWNPARSPGGSSGGAAVAVAMGYGPLALSTDGAGSGRIPASCCGTIGLKPTHGTIPHETHSDLFSGLTCIASMARTTADLALMHNVMSGPFVGDPWSMAGRGAATLPADPVAGLLGLRVRYLTHMGNDWLDPEVEAACGAMVRALADAGAIVDNNPAGLDWGLTSGRRLMRAYQAARFAPLLERWRDRLDARVVAGIEEGQALSLTDLFAAQTDRSRLYREVQAIFAGCDVLVTPVVSTPTLPVQQQSDAPLVTENRDRGPLREAWYPYTIPFNLSGNPALSVPCGMSADGLPIGLQLVGPWHGEGSLVAIAAAIEALQPWTSLWPRVSSS